MQSTTEATPARPSRHRRTGVALALAGAVALVGLAGCSSDSSDGGKATTTKAPSTETIPATLDGTIPVETTVAETTVAETPETTAVAEETTTTAPPPLLVAKADIEAALARDLNAQTGETFKVTCEEDLMAEAGVEQTCTTIVPTGELYDVVITVNSVAGGRLNYGMNAYPH